METKLKRKIEYSALSNRVLVVAVCNYDERNNTLFDWTAYIDSVLGYDHKTEAEQVARDGSNLWVRLAKILFPRFDITLYRH